MICEIFLLFFLSLLKAQPTNSDSCLVYNNSAGVCLECIEGFYLNYFFCAPCAPLCSCSNINDYCVSCRALSIKDGLISVSSYKVIPPGRENLQHCRLCSEAISHCIECSSQTKCNKCMDGRYVLPSGNCSNQTCGINCQVCLSEDECDLCTTGYYITDVQGKSICSTDLCMQSCVICSSQDTCELCAPFYYEQNGTCLDCPVNCTVCNDSDTCTVCMPGSYFINGTCEDVGLSNCISVAGGFYNPTCLVCEPGYYNAQGSCTQCSGCELCSTAFICLTQCQQGFEQFNYNCIQKLDETNQKLIFLPISILTLIWSIF